MQLRSFNRVAIIYLYWMLDLFQACSYSVTVNFSLQRLHNHTKLVYLSKYFVHLWCEAYGSRIGKRKMLVNLEVRLSISGSFWLYFCIAIANRCLFWSARVTEG